MQKAYQMLVDEVNAKGGVKGQKLRLVVEDDRNDPTTVRAAVDRLVTREQAIAILGTYGSANGVAGAQAAERYGVPNIQLIYNATTAQSIQLHRSLKQLNVPIAWIARSPSFGLDKDLVEALGKDLEYVVGLDEWYVGMKSPGNAEFERNFQARYGTIPTRMEAKGYAIGQLAIRAMEQAPALTPQAIRDTLLKGQIPTIIGSVTFKENGQRHPQNLVGQIRQGKAVILWPPEMKTGEPKPAPDWSAR